ncbi:hypothetical protein EVAR_28922_1 [Eumeta japonica]|uniref:Uncharacterized protein n=1 Tax=Eumeta variegata TaxID=151549 RepID=A0A4C1YN34_EUMVA|nr:hypothetical protein EVAR_28922_1 [Eumeta japonica]
MALWFWGIIKKSMRMILYVHIGAVARGYRWINHKENVRSVVRSAGVGATDFQRVLKGRERSKLRFFIFGTELNARSRLKVRR